MEERDRIFGDCLCGSIDVGPSDRAITYENLNFPLVDGVDQEKLSYTLKCTLKTLNHLDHDFSLAALMT
jgi:hypothetical protein